MSWTGFKYGQKARHYAEYWLPTGASLGDGGSRGCLIYAPGGGWSASTQRAFYATRDQFTIDAGGNEVGNRLFLEKIEDAGNTNYTVISMMYGMAYSGYYNGGVGPEYSFDRWDAAVSYVKKDLIGKAGNVYECLVANTNVEPTVTSGWETSWRLIPRNDPLGNPEYGNLGLYTKVTSQPAYMDEGIRDVQLMVQFVKQNADAFGIDPEKIVLMGDSAGGNTVGCAAYSAPAKTGIGTSSNDSVARDVHSAGLGAVHNDSSVAGVILEITPSDWRYFEEYANIHGDFLFGMTNADQAAWDSVPDSVKAAVSPLGALKATGNAIPTFLHYYQDYITPSTAQDPPFATGSPYHKADNGEYIRDELLRLGQTNVEFRTVTGADGAPGGSQDHSTQGTQNYTDMMNWLNDLLGF